MLRLPPALTYVIARTLAPSRRRPMGRPSAARVDGLLRDTVRCLLATGASAAEAQAVVADVCETAHAWHVDPDLDAELAELEARARAYADAVASREPAPEEGGAGPCTATDAARTG